MKFLKAVPVDEEENNVIFIPVNRIISIRDGMIDYRGVSGGNYTDARRIEVRQSAKEIIKSVVEV